MSHDSNGVAERTLGYILGHAEAEHRRLQLQATWLEPITLRVLHAAGLKSGMNVLDLGTGAGDVAMLAGRMVGAAGRVLGTDVDPSVIALAQRRAETAGSANVRFECCAASNSGSLRSFDLVICRLVAVHQRDRVAFLRNAAARVRQGGIVCLIEPAYDTVGPWSEPVVPAYDDIIRWQLLAFESAGVTSVGFGFVGLFAAAGLREPTVVIELPTAGPGSSMLDWMVLTLGTLMPHIERAEIVTAAEVDFDTLEERARRAIIDAGAQLRTWAVAGAWTVVS